MRTLLAAFIIGAAATPTLSAECAKYVHEYDPGEWFVVNDNRIRWNGAPNEPDWFIAPDENFPKVGVAIKQIGQENDADQFLVRFGNLDGVEGLIYDSAFYRKTDCSAEDRAPKATKKLKPNLFDSPLFDGLD